jgi:hypothetical protein
MYRIRVLYCLFPLFFISEGYPASEDIFEDEWLYAKTEDFELISNASKRSTQEIVEDLYEFKNAFEHVFSGIQKYPDPYFMYVTCKDKVTLDALRKREKDEGESTVNFGGVFGGDNEAGYAAINARKWETRLSKELAFQEYTQRLFAKSGEALPLWLEVGIAMTFQTFQVTRKNAVFGHPNEGANYFLTVHTDSFMPFNEFLGLNHNSSEYKKRGARNVFFSTSWAFTHFCMFGREGKYKEAFLQFVDANKAGDRSEETFKKLFGMSFAQAKLEIKKYLGGKSHDQKTESYTVIKVPREELPQKYRCSLQKSNESDVRRIVGGILSYDEDRLSRQRAREILVSARAKSPEDVKLIATIGLLEELSGDLDKAIDLYEQAVAGEVGLSHVYVHLAELKLKKRKETSFDNLTIEETAFLLELLFKGRSIGSSGSRLYRTFADVYLFSEFEVKKGHLAILDEGLRSYARDYELALKTIQLKYKAGLNEEADYLLSLYSKATIPENVRNSFLALKKAQKESD